MPAKKKARPLYRRLRHLVGPWLVHGLYRLLYATWRVSFEESPAFRAALAARQPVVLAHWHGDELALIHVARRYRIATLTSHSRDGELMDEVLRRLGAVTARGSSSKGGAGGLRALVQLCRKEGHTASFAVDGPRGPIHDVKPGVFEFSRLVGAPVCTLSVGVSRPWVLHRSWNRAVIPKPFSRVVVRVADCLPPVTRAMDPRAPELAQQLKSALDAHKAALCRQVGVERP